MQLGLHALGIGSGADRAVIDAVAVAADVAGFATLWAGEHVVMVDRSATELGIDELVLVESPPEDSGAVAEWISALAEKWRSAR